MVEETEELLEKNIKIDIPSPIVKPETLCKRIRESRNQTSRSCHCSGSSSTPKGIFTRDFHHELYGGGEYLHLFDSYTKKGVEFKSYFANNFIIFNHVGWGSSACVLKASPISAPYKKYAIKTISLNRRSGFRMSEITFLNKHIKHENIISYYASWKEGTDIFIMTELCAFSLERVLRENKALDENDLWILLLQVSKGLKHIHDSGYVHLDIKSQNILVSFDGSFKIADFGCVFSLENPSDTFPPDGDGKYLPSEVLCNSVTTAVDIFSLGITLFEIICDIELPLNGEYWNDLRSNKLPWELNIGYSTKLVSIVTKMMDQNPSLRPETDEIISVCEPDSMKLSFEIPKDNENSPVRIKNNDNHQVIANGPENDARIEIFQTPAPSRYDNVNAQGIPFRSRSTSGGGANSIPLQEITELAPIARSLWEDFEDAI